MMTVPVTRFRPMWHRIDLVYAPWYLYQDVFVVFIGIMANTILFGILDRSTYVAKKYCKCMPKQWYKAIAYYGVYAVMDPFIVLFLDIVSGNTENGDYFKFYTYFEKRSNNGPVGAYFTFFMVFMLSVVSGYVFYRYMVFRFMDGRILDLYRRLSGQYKEFFIPLDQEVSIKYLQWVIMRAKKKNCVISFTKQEARDKYGLDKEVSFLKIYKIVEQGLKFNRMFFKDFDGALREVPQKRVWLNDIELNKCLKAARHGEAAVYGDQVLEELEKHGMKDDEAGYLKVIEVLCVNTKEKRKIENELGDTKTQLFVAAKLESQS